VNIDLSDKFVMGQPQSTQAAEKDNFTTIVSSSGEKTQRLTVRILFKILLSLIFSPKFIHTMKKNFLTWLVGFQTESVIEEVEKLSDRIIDQKIRIACIGVGARLTSLLRILLVRKLENIS
jgi:hypothetical protein